MQGNFRVPAERCKKIRTPKVWKQWMSVNWSRLGDSTVGTLGFDHVCRTCGKECFKRQCQSHFSGKTQLNPSQIVGSNPPFAAVAEDHWTRTERQNAPCWRPLRAWPRAFPSLIKGSWACDFSTLVNTFWWSFPPGSIDVN